MALGGPMGGMDRGEESRSRLPRPIEKSERVAAVLLEFALANELLMIANTTRMPPSVPSTSVRHAAPRVAAVESEELVLIRSGPKYTVAA